MYILPSPSLENWMPGRMHILQPWFVHGGNSMTKLSSRWDLDSHLQIANTEFVLQQHGQDWLQPRFWWRRDPNPISKH